MLLQVTHFYHEFHPDALIKQPWNAFSSLVFFVPVIYWLWNLRGHYREHPVLTSILPLLFLNGLGSTLFHARNGGFVFMMLDVIPPLLMMMYLSIYFWKVSIGSWYKGIFIILGFIALNVLNMNWHNHIGNISRGINVFYAINGMMILLPVIFVLKNQNWSGWKLIVTAFSLIGIALLFRTLDYPNPNPLPEILPQGTHFLWHIFSAMAVFPLGYFLKGIRKTKPELSPNTHSVIA